jgi:hypothetical protein
MKFTSIYLKIDKLVQNFKGALKHPGREHVGATNIPFLRKRAQNSERKA